jgi:hypothetical protein
MKEVDQLLEDAALVESVYDAQIAHSERAILRRERASLKRPPLVLRNDSFRDNLLALSSDSMFSFHYNPA